MSASLQRARPQITEPRMFWAISARPRSRRARRSESRPRYVDAQVDQRLGDLHLLGQVHAAPGDCSPSRSVVSKILMRRLDMVDEGGQGTEVRSQVWPRPPRGRLTIASTQVLNRRVHAA